MRDSSRFYFNAFLLILYISSKSYANDEFNSGSIESEANQLGIERDATVGLHGGYRPRPKKFSKRFLENKSELQESKAPDCAIMYKHNEPVGILQPYEESYRFLPVNGEPTLVDLNQAPSKRKTVMDLFYPGEVDDGEYDEDLDGFADEKYPSVFAKFKIDSRLDRSLDPKTSTDGKSVAKRESLDDGDRPFEEDIEEQLTNILDDMSLIEDYPNQDIGRKQMEDENLELGTNKINLVKEDREKRNNGASVDISAEQQALEGCRSEPSSGFSVKKNEDNFAQTVSAGLGTDIEDSALDKKRISEKCQDADEANNKMSVVNSRNADDAYGTRVEREIRDQIHELREEVRKEIDQLKSSNSDSPSEAGIAPIDENEGGSTREHIRRKRSIPYRKLGRNNEAALIGLNPVLSNQNGTFNNRSLKQVPSEIPQGNISLLPRNQKKNRSSRKKRQITAEDENSYEIDDSEAEFDDEDQSEFGEDEGFDDTDDASFASNEGQECSCDKNSDNCKCDKNSPSNEKTSGDPQVFGKNNAQEHCACNRNDHDCKCGTGNGVVDEIPSLQDDDYPNTMTRKFKPKKRNASKRCITNRENRLSANSINQKTEGGNLLKRATKPRKSAVVRPFENGEYFVDLLPDVYKLSETENTRGKRHFVAVKQKNAASHSRFRRRVQKEENNKQPRQLIDMSEEDLFGALPQSFEGELARYKRVKRNRKE